MKRPLATVFLIAMFLNTTGLFGQFYTTGESPASIKWDQIRTPHFKIVFPAGLEVDANKMANRLEYYRLNTSEGMENRINKKFPVLLHSTSVLSNGYVTLAPRRMELVITPSQDSYALDWFTQLTLHEYRHVAQLSRLNRNFTSVMGWLSGEIAAGSISSLMPSWFYEGDAVFNETRLPESGRGRIPGFEMPLRTLLLDHTANYSYDKAVFGSYRNFVPDQYRYGYQMVGYARALYGNRVWTDALDYTSGHPYFLWPLAFYLKKNYGFYKNGLYKQTIYSLKQQYNSEKENITYSNYSSINRRRDKIYSNYILPKDLGNGNTLARLTGMDDPGSFVVIDSTGTAKRLFITGASTELKTDIYGNRIIWDELASDVRWDRRDYSEIRVADLKSGKSKALTKKTRYFSPDFSPNGDLVAVAETDLRNSHFLTILNAQSGEIVQKIPAPENRALQYPEWISETDILAISVSDKGKQMEVFSLEHGNWSVLLPFTRFDIAEPVNYKNYMLFRSSFNGIENIYAISKANSALLYQVTFSGNGAYHPAVSNDMLNLLFSDYGSDGFNLVTIPLDTADWKETGQVSVPRARWTDPSVKGDSDILPLNRIPDVSYENRTYRKSAHLINFHSWLPFYTDWENFSGNLNDVAISPGIMLYSQNLLSTLISSIGYRYNRGYHEVIPTLSFRGWYPVIEVSGQFGGPLRTLPLPEGLSLPENAGPYHEINLKVFVPLVVNRGKYITQVQPTAELEYTGTWYYSGSTLHRGIDYLHFRLNINHYLRYSQRDLYPRWGQYIAATFTQTPFEKEQFGNLLSTQAVLYFPGITAHHHFYIRGGLQIQHPATYYLPINRISFPRGYSTAISGKISTVMLNYSFPVGYPDWSVGPLLYLKRFRLNLFLDWSYGEDIKELTSTGVIDYTGVYRSFGTEILADMHLIRIIFPVTVGIRLGYIPNERKFFSELMFNLNTEIF